MDVATFAKQLKEDGIDAARTEAEKILTEAKKQAEIQKKDGENSVKKMKSQAENDIAQMKSRCDAELRLVARDLLLGVKKDIEKIAANLLKAEVKESLSSAEVVQNALIELIKGQKAGQWELALGPTVGKELTESTVQVLFKKEDSKVSLIEGLKQSGFELKSTGSAEVIEVTEDSVTAAFRLLLSGELAKYLESI